VKTNRGRAGTSTSVCEASTSSTEPRGLYQPCLYTKKADKDYLVGRRRFGFCSSSFVPSASFVRRGANFESRQLSKFLSLSLLDLRVLVKGLICKGLNRIIFDHESGSSGTDSRGTD